MSEQLKQELEADTGRLETETVADSETIGEREEKTTEGKLEDQGGNKKLSGNCMLCGKTEDKNKMVTLTARAVRGGKATSFGHMCHSCFAKWLTSHSIPVPDLENKKEIEDGKEKL